MRQDLTATVVVERRTVIQDDYGGHAGDYAAVATYVARIRQMLRVATERVVAGAVAAIDSWEISLPWDADVVEEDRIIGEGKTFEVYATNKQHTDRLLLTVYARKSA